MSESAQNFSWRCIGDYTNIETKKLNSRGANFNGALQRKTHLCISFLGIERPEAQFSHTVLYTHVSVSDLYTPRISPHISCSRTGRPIVGINKSVTDT